MSQIRRSGPRQEAANATNTLTQTVPQPADGLCHWRDVIEWWTDPRLAYAAGLADGYRLARQEIEAEDEQLHREAVRAVLSHVAVVDRRRLADAGVSAA